MNTPDNSFLTSYRSKICSHFSEEVQTQAAQCILLAYYCTQEITQRCRLSWLTNSALSPNAGGGGELRAQRDYYCKRAILRLSSSKILTPLSPSPPGECVLPAFIGGRTHSPGGEGGGGSIFWKTRDIGLPSYSNNLSTVAGVSANEYSCTQEPK